MKKTGLLLLLVTLLLAACSNSTNEEIEEPQNVVEEEKTEDTTTENEEKTTEPESSNISEEEKAAFEEQFYAYINDLNQAVVLETESFNIYNNLIMTDADEATASETIKSDVLPTYEKYLTQLEDIAISHNELQEFHNHLVEVSYIQYDAFIMLVEGLDANNDAVIAEAFQLMEQYATESVEVIHHLNGLAVDYGVPYDLDHALEAL